MPPHKFFKGFKLPEYDKFNLFPLVKREEWGALPPTETVPEKIPKKTVVFAFNTGRATCTSRADCDQAMRELQRDHMALGYPDIYYNFAIGGDGNIHEGRGWRVRHSANYGDHYGPTVVVGIIGTARDEEKEYYPPFDVMLLKFVKYGIQNKFIRKDLEVKEDHKRLFVEEEKVLVTFD